MGFISTDLAKSYQRVEQSEEDALIALLVSAAEKKAVKFLNRQVFESDADMQAAIAAGTAGANPIVVTDDMKVAMLKIFSDLYENREDAAIDVELSKSSRDLLRGDRLSPGV